MLAVVRKELDNGKKKFTQWTPYDLDRDLWVPAGLKKDRPLLDISKIQIMDSRILIVEGEKCRDVVTRHWPTQPVTTWAGGTNAYLLTDWTTLRGKKVLLVSDDDGPGRKAMLGIGDILLDLDCDVEIALSPGETKADVADWLKADGGAKTLDRIKGLITQHARSPVEDDPKPVSGGTFERKDRNALETGLG